jgi:hypothetical protein
MENPDRFPAPPRDVMTEEEKEELRRMLKSIQPQTELGRQLIELSLEGVEQGVTRMDVDEILEYLGRDRRER